MTYGVVSEREEWKRFRKSSKDEFEKKYKEKREYPIILKINEANRLDELISKDDLNKMKNVNELIQKLKET